jgi:hypothetical protein
MRANISLRHIAFALALIGGALWGRHAPSAQKDMVPADGPSHRGEGSYSLPRGFEANTGQTNSGVKFLSRGNGYRLFLTDTEAIVSVHAPDRNREPAIVRMRPAGANRAPRVVGEAKRASTANYLRGGRSNPALEHIPTYDRVRYEAVYSGIDLVFHDNGGQLEYDFFVSAGADPRQIRLEFTGADSLSVNAAGELVLHTAVGDLRQPAPVIYQDIGGTRQTIGGGYILEGSNQIGFRVSEYDRARPLVIDPVLAYSTYLGGSGDDSGRDIVVDAGGNAYVVGLRPSVGFPETLEFDAYVAKFNASGALLWTTDVGDICDDDGRGIALDTAGNIYITGQLGNCFPFPTLTPGAFVAKLAPTGAGSYMFAFSDEWSGGADLGQAVAVDAAGNAYVTGITTTDQFPITPGAFQQIFGGGIGDGFVVKVNASGTALVFGTFLGGAAFESPNDLVLDAGGNAYIVGSTESHDFPMRNALQPVHPGWGPGDQGGFVTKLRADGTDLVFSTYLGGGPLDIAQGVALDALGNVYVAGVTQSSEFPITPGAAQPLPGDNRWCFFTICTDAFVTKINAAGSAFVYSTYLGGNIFDEGNGIAVDNAGNAYVTGNTNSFTFPTVDAFQPALAGDLDAFVTKLNPSGTAFEYSSYLGGSEQTTADFEGEDGGIRIAVQPNSGSAYVVGITRSPNFPVLSAHQPVFGGGNCGILGYRCSDAFVTRIGWGCTYTIAPTARTVAPEGEAGTVTVTASAGTCTWSATSAAPWITITSGATGTGSGAVGYAVAANTTGAPRTGILNIAGNPFTVTQSAASAATVTVTAPNGGEKLYSNTPYTIAWAGGGAASFDVSASADGGATYAPVAGCTGLPAAARSCVWTTPGPASTNARIKVTAHSAAGSIADVSNGAFTIVDGAALVTVTFPNSAVNLGIGSTQVIKWTHNLGTNSFVRIELSRDGGLTYPETLAAAHKNAKATSGSFNWVVAGPATAGAQARIRVSWIAGAAGDTSNQNFRIAPVFITVTAPLAGTVWAFDSTQIVKWTTNLGALDRVNVQLSTTGVDGTYTMMAGGSNVIATKKKAGVQVPSAATSSARIKVGWANPPAGLSATGVNGGDFSIQPPF